MRIEYPTLFLAILCYSLFIGAAILLWPVAPAAAILVMAVMGALQSSLAHECLHGHPFRNPHLNEALAYLPLTLAYPYRRYRSLHLKHHENASLTDPFEDPESYYRASLQFDRLPRPLRWLVRSYAVNPMCGVHGRIMSPDAFRFSCCSGRWVFRYGSISLVCAGRPCP